MPHPVHNLLQRFLDSQQYAFDPRERDFWPSEQQPEEPHAKANGAAKSDSNGTAKSAANGAAKSASNGHAYKGFEYRI